MTRLGPSPHSRHDNQAPIAPPCHCEGAQRLRQSPGVSSLRLASSRSVVSNICGQALLGMVVSGGGTP